MLGAHLELTRGAIGADEALALDFLTGRHRLNGRFVALEDAPGLAFARAGPATAPRADGSVAVFANDAPARTDLGLWLEGSVANLLARADLADWGLDAGGGGVVGQLIPEAGPAPDGSANAARVQLSRSGAGFSRASRLLSGPSARRVFSVWMRTAGGETRDVGLRIDLEGRRVAVDGVWRRFEIAQSADSASATPQILVWDVLETAETADLWVWGAQVETGAASGGLVLTTGTPAERAPDALTIAGPSGVFTEVGEVGFDRDLAERQTVWSAAFGADEVWVERLATGDLRAVARAGGDQTEIGRAAAAGARTVRWALAREADRWRFAVGGGVAGSATIPDLASEGSRRLGARADATAPLRAWLRRHDSLPRTLGETALMARTA